MIDINLETPIRLKEVSKLYPAIFTSPRSVFRSSDAGVFNRSRSAKVRLETFKGPACLMTTREAVARFLAQLDEKDVTTAPPAASRVRELEKVDAELAEMGFGGN